MNVFNKRAPLLAVVALTGLSLITPLSALAQTASQITKPSYAPSVIKPTMGGGLTLPTTSGLNAPKGADKLYVTPSGLDVEGQLPELKAETAQLEASIKGRRVSVSTLFATARALGSAYVQAGYVLTRVTLPPQTIRDGMPLTLIVTHGYIERIDTSAFQGKTRRRIEAVLQPLVGNDALTPHELERRLLLAGDIPGVLLRSTLKAGNDKGGSVLVVDGHYTPVVYSLSLDNHLGDNLGHYSTSIGANLNNLLGLGDVGYLQLGGYAGMKDNVFNTDPRNRQMVAGATVPLSINGLWLNVEAVDSRTHPSSRMSFTLLDHYQRISTKLGYNWLRRRNINTSSQIGFDVTDETQRLEMNNSRTDWTKDRLRVFRATQNGSLYTGWGGFISGHVTVSHGLSGLGARHGTTALPMSRSGADPDFTKLDFSSRYSQGLLHQQMQWSVLVKGQTSFSQVMSSSEAFDLGGIDGVSAFESGTIMGDSGALVRSELSLPMSIPRIGAYATGGMAVSPYVFGAAGVTKLEKATAVEHTSTRAHAVGVGLRFGFSRVATSTGTTLTMEYADGHGSHGTSDNRFNLLWQVQF